MKILPANKEAAIECAKYLSDGELVIYPTETVYGLGADATNENAVKKVFSAKGREFNKPVSIAVASVAQAAEIAEFDDIAKTLAKKFLPGPLTLILPSRINLPSIVVNEKIGIRVPAGNFAQELLRIFRRPIVATSANLSGLPEPRTPREIDERFFDKVQIIVDDGPTKYGKPSTVVEIVGNAIRFLREGSISKAEIEAVLK